LYTIPEIIRPRARMILKDYYLFFFSISARKIKSDLPADSIAKRITILGSTEEKNTSCEHHTTLYKFKSHLRKYKEGRKFVWWGSVSITTFLRHAGFSAFAQAQDDAIQTQNKKMLLRDYNHCMDPRVTDVNSLFYNHHVQWHSDITPCCHLIYQTLPEPSILFTARNIKCQCQLRPRPSTP
jgi:hypothetical protein